MLGNNYTPEFFNGIPDKAGDPLKRICNETLEDLEGFKSILEDFGVDVIQPQMDRSERFLDNPKAYNRGPLQPRDYQLVLGNKCFVHKGRDHKSIEDKLNEYSPVLYPQDLVKPYYASEKNYNNIKGSDFPTYNQFLENRTNKDYFLDFVWKELLDYSDPYEFKSTSSRAFMIGKRLYVGIDVLQDNYPLDKDQIDIDEYEKNFLDRELPEFEKFDVHVIPLEGHSDGNFHPIKPGAILSLYDVQNYSQTFPQWDVCYLPDQGWSTMESFYTLKMKNKGKWWLAGEEDNDEFTYFVETWLQDWVGYVEETVFDVNVLVLDEHHVCVSQRDNKIVNTFLKKHKMEPVYVPWRHRYFWDGGLHCITLDLYREGIQKDYFGGTLNEI